MTITENRISRIGQKIDREPIPGIGIRFGKYVPNNWITNQHVEALGVDKGNGEIMTAAGILKVLQIERRARAFPRQTEVDLAINALSQALGNLREVDALTVSTGYPNGSSYSAEVARRLGLTPAFHLDGFAACSGFVRLLVHMAQSPNERQQQSAGDINFDFKGKRIAMAAGEILSRTLHPISDKDIARKDPSFNDNIFSDGGAAWVFDFGAGGLDVLGYITRSVPSDIIRMPIDPKKAVAPYILEPIPPSDDGILFQDGHKVFEFVLQHLPGIHRELLERTGVTLPEVKLVIPHQGSGKMIDSFGRRIGEPNKVYKYVEDGNFSSASLPMALMKAVNEGRVQPGDLVELLQFGAGMHVAGVIARLGAPQ